MKPRTAPHFHVRAGHMRLSDALPDFATSVASALDSEGYAHLRSRVLTAAVESWTYDPSVKAGYIYLAQLTPIHPGETSAATTLAFGPPHWFNIDLRVNEGIFGIELLADAKEITSALDSYRAP